MNTHPIIKWVLRLLPAAILLQTLYFKFTGHPESMMLFEKLNAEPYGRIAVGVFELIAGILLIVPKTTRFGALLAAGLMVGAIGAHAFVIGIESDMDGGYLFILAVITFICSIINLRIYKSELISDYNTVYNKDSAQGK